MPETDTANIPTLAHGSAELSTGVRLHYVTAGDGPQAIVLVHGYPQTWWSWRHMIGPLAAAGFRVIAPEYRGAGSSSKPLSGYDKRTMAADIAKLLSDALKIDQPVTVVGNDIGMMVAYAFGSEFPDRVKRLVLMEAVLPGSAAYDLAVATSKLVGAPMWHFFFHNAGDGLAEMLTAGRERLYLRHFYDRHAFNPEAIGPADLDSYADDSPPPGLCGPGSRSIGPSIRMSSTIERH
ncbi:alpha/beta hydrolase [Rhizobium leguminosarum]|uniref:alpha/beta fold hydrolase n=1 Tax=Rhizobium leguminosarum TaxID=384 RepID=UPI0028C4D22E|nr:alpha/beta hydrolase [Rhizobium leguminosarum]